MQRHPSRIHGENWNSVEDREKRYRWIARSIAKRLQAGRVGGLGRPGHMDLSSLGTHVADSFITMCIARRVSEPLGCLANPLRHALIDYPLPFLGRQ